MIAFVAMPSTESRLERRRRALGRAGVWGWLAVVWWACSGSSGTTPDSQSPAAHSAPVRVDSPVVSPAKPAVPAPVATVVPTAPIAPAALTGASGAPATLAGSSASGPTMTPATPLQPVLDPKLEQLRREAQDRVLGPAAPPDATDAVYSFGRFVPVEHEPALDHFHRALERLAAGADPDGKVRILAYGASHTQADIYPGYLRAYLQSRFGDGGLGFVLFGRVNRWPTSRGARVRQRAFAVHHANFLPSGEPEPLGLFGAALVGRQRNAFAEVVTRKDSRNTRFEVHYFRQPRGGDFEVQLDGQTLARVPTASEAPGSAFHAFETTPGQHTIRVRLAGNGPVRLFGLVAETATPGVVVDTLGISGAQMSANLRWQEDAWAEALRHRQPDLVTFAYGTNESADQHLSLPAYEQDLVAVLTRLRRALPQTSCVLIAPFDVPAWVRPRLLKVLEVQRRVSKDFGCGFWDGYAFMGGEGAIRRWASAKPPLASGDFIHLTHLGYVHAGMAIGDALMRRFDASQPHGVGSERVASPALSPVPTATP